MLKHEFGIMQNQPKKGETYIDYAPEKYGCISVDDDCIEPILEKLGNINCYWHTLDRPEKRIAYCGITLIPPRSLDIFADAVRYAPNLSELEELLVKARREDKYVIHFGI